MMNHDYTHCADYDAALCPKSCFRAQVTAELEADRVNIVGVPISWAYFKGSPECRLTNPEPKRTNADRIRAMTDEELARMFLLHDDNVYRHCPSDTIAEYCQEKPEIECCDCNDCWLDWLKQEEEE